MKHLSKLLFAVILLAVGYLAYGVYSMSWSERLLSPVKNGMSMDDVRMAVGTPLDEYDRGGGRMTWNYNKWFMTDAVVYFDEQGLVMAKEVD